MEGGQEAKKGGKGVNANCRGCPAPRAARLGSGALHTHRCLIPKRPRAERADLGKRPLPTQSWGLGSEAGPGNWPDGEILSEARKDQRSHKGWGWTPDPDCRSRAGVPARTSASRSQPLRPSPSASPWVRERPHFSSRRSGRLSVVCMGSAHWSNSMDAPPSAPNRPIVRGFTERSTRRIVTVLRRFWGSLGLSGLCPPAPGLSPKETNGTRAQKGAHEASRAPLEISASSFSCCSPACPRVDARVAKGSL